MKRRVVLAGCGSVSRAWLSAIAEFDDVDLVGLVDISHEAIEHRVEEFTLTPESIGDDVGKVISDSGADLLFDCTIPEAHVRVVTTALECGCDVMGEKPMADSMENASLMVETAERCGRRYAVMQNRRYDPQIRRFRRLVGSGEIGSLTTLNADFYLGAHFGGFREEMNHVLVLDMAIHSFDEARYIAHADPVRVFCHEWNPAGSWYRDGASAVCIFEMSNGIVFTYRGSWCSEGLNTTWECDWRAVGTAGSATWDGADRIVAERVAGNEGFKRPLEAIEPPPIETLPSAPGHKAAIRDFLDALASGRKPLTDCTDNIKSVAMVHAAIASAESGQRERVTDT